MLLNNNNNDPKNKKFDVVQSQFDAYKRWGYVVDENSSNKNAKISETNSQNDEKEKVGK